MSGDGLVRHFQAYTAWRGDVSARLQAFRRWLATNELADAQADLRLQTLLERLEEDRLSVAFVAEFSRGKSELINAIFFSDYGRRLLPSTTGRTTMCPTEILWDPEKPPSVQLLPIETRARHASTSEFKRYPDEWKVLPVDVTSGDSLSAAFQEVRATRRVPLEEAKHYGLFLDGTPEEEAVEVVDGTVEIPLWRHAIINFPHPLLQQGLVILDTPGLNAIGTEPELTLHLLPNAHAVLFVLALDTGVSRSDNAIWRDYVYRPPARAASRIVVLNKIDSLWDGLRSEADVAAEIERQVSYCSSVLDLDRERIFAVSAQKALVARITGDAPLLERSGIVALERALSTELIPAKREIVRETTRGELADVVANVRAILEARLNSVQEQLAELRALRGKNLDVVDALMRKVRLEKEDFERSLGRFQALRGVFAKQTNRLFTHLGMDALNEESKQTVYEIRRSQFTAGVRAGMARYFKSVRGQLDESAAVVSDIHSMMAAMYHRFADEHGLRLGTPARFSLLRYQKELDRLEEQYRTQFDTPLNLLTNEKMTLTQKFFETLASEVRRLYRYANRETERWLRSVMAPMESQVREHQLMLRRRLESVKRIHQATETLEDRVAELAAVERTLWAQLADLERFARDGNRALDRDPIPVAAAA
jgi:hypothetical protein